MVDADRLLIVREACELLGYTPQHTRLLIRTGRLRAIRVGRDWAIRENDVREFLDRRSAAPLFRLEREAGP